MEKISVLIADDHPMFRKGVHALVLATPEFEIAGEAATGEEAVAAAMQLQPDLILMDIKMPGVNGIDAGRRPSPGRSPSSGRRLWTQTGLSPPGS